MENTRRQMDVLGISRIISIFEHRDLSLPPNKLISGGRRKIFFADRTTFEAFRVSVPFSICREGRQSMSNSISFYYLSVTYIRYVCRLRREEDASIPSPPSTSISPSGTVSEADEKGGQRGHRRVARAYERANDRPAFFVPPYILS